jgi:hypothetical protein
MSQDQAKQGIKLTAEEVLARPKSYSQAVQNVTIKRQDGQNIENFIHDKNIHSQSYLRVNYAPYCKKDV